MKERKFINISISKKNKEVINKILNNWNKNNIDIAPKICEEIVLMNKLEKSPTFLNMLTAYELIEKILKISMDNVEPSDIENILEKIVSIDTSKINSVINNKSSGDKEDTFIKAISQQIVDIPNKKIENPKETNINNSENIYFKKNKTESTKEFINQDSIFNEDEEFVNNLQTFMFND